MLDLLYDVHRYFVGMENYQRNNYLKLVKLYIIFCYIKKISLQSS